MSAQTIDFTKFGTSFKDTQKENTLKYLDYLRNESGMNELTEAHLLAELKRLNYSIEKPMCHDYYNNMNERHYLARSMSYKDNKTKQSFAHFEQSFANAKNLEELQKIRQWNFVFDGKRIWDL